MSKILETARLVLRELDAGDAAFILELVNEPAWHRFIGDRGIRTVEAARDYILKGPVSMYRRLGFGLWLVETRDGGIPIGICGLIKRDALADVDLGFAFLAVHHRKGYAFEATRATIDHGKRVLGLTRLVAVVSPGNEASCRLLEKLGFGSEGMICLSEGAPAVKLYGLACGDTSSIV